MKLLNIKPRYLWIIFVICVIVCGITVYLTSYLNHKTITMFILIPEFLFTGFIFQSAITKSFMKTKKKEYNTLVFNYDGYEFSYENLRKEKFNSHKINHGIIFYRLIKDTLIKIIFITDNEKYKDSQNEDNEFKTPGIDKCKYFIGLEIFISHDNEIIQKLYDYSFQGEKIYYEALFIDNENIIKPNHIIPFEQFNNDYNYIMEVLGIRNEENNNL